MPPRSGDVTRATSLARSNGCSLRKLTSPSGERRENRDLVTGRHGCVEPGVREVHRTERTLGKTGAGRKRPELTQDRAHGGRRWKCEGDRRLARGLRVAREEEYADGHGRSSGNGHRLEAAAPGAAELPGWTVRE